MNDIKVSTIIPVYNAEDYLNQCLDSVITQSLDEIEIVCVNDGSTDNSLKILEEYSNNDDRIVIITQENAGLGAARNTGMKYAKGEYINFLDSDDWLDIDACAILYETAKMHESDLIIFKTKPFDEDTGEFFEREDYNLESLKKYCNKVILNYKSLNKSLLFDIPVSACNKFYKKSFVDRLNADFPEGLIFEDNPFFFKIFLNAQNIFVLNEFLLYRRVRQGSIMTSCDERYVHAIDISNLIFNVFKENNLYNEFKENLIHRKMEMLFFLGYGNIDEKYKSLMFGRIKQDLSNISKNALLHQEFEDHLTEKFLSFYSNTLDASSYNEFELLNQIHDLNKKIAKLKKSNKKLSNKNKEYSKKIKHFSSTFSWKITKPLRYVEKLFGKI